MRRLAETLIGLLLAFYSWELSAAGEISVDALNYPAWLVRDYQALPLTAGSKVQSDDLIRTGKGGRVRLQLADGSALKIGESSRLVIAKPTSFQVLRGVFRITSGPSNGDIGDPGLAIEIGAISATTKAADFWGRASLAQDAVCLIDGALLVDRVEMKQALSCYVKPAEQPPLPVDLIDMRQHQLWMAETELKLGAGIASASGAWQLVLISLTDSNRAEQVLAGYREKGFPARRKTVVRDGRTLHRLLLPGFESKDAALKARKRIEAALGTSETWVWRED